jgi:hypothetical protein
VREARQPGGLDIPAQRRIADGAEQAGANRIQVQALVPQGNRILLLDRHCDGAWSIPAAWVHPGGTVPGTLECLCSHRLGLTCWKADFAATTVCHLSDDTRVLQLTFVITLRCDTAPSWPWHARWWPTDTEPPNLHRPSRPVLELLFGIPPIGPG